MSFRTKLFLVLGATGLAPLCVLGWLSFSVNRGEIEKTVGRAQEATAIAAARACERWVSQGVEGLSLSLAAIPFDELSAAETATILRIPYRQLEAIEAIALLDEKGNALLPPLVESKRQGEPPPPADLPGFGRSIPLDYALAAGTAIGPPWVDASGKGRISIALRIGKSTSRVVAAELSLAQLDRQLRELAQDGAEAWLVTRDGTVIAGAGARPSDDERRLVADGAGRTLVRTVRRADGKSWLSAWAPVGDLGWGVVVAQPSSLALRAANRVGLYTLFWAAVALVLVGLLGALLSRGISAPVRALSVAAAALREGRYDQPAEVESKDELGAFAEAFNHMAREVQRRDEEIRRWNSELQERVLGKTRELKEAQDQILRSRRLAALGSMGAGLAHELNNPLTAIGGIASLLKQQLGKDPNHGPMLQMLADQVKRVARIGADLRQFAEQERVTAGRKFALQTPVLAALEACKEELLGHGIALETDLRAQLPEAQGDPAQIQQLVGHLVQNAIHAMPDGGKLTVALADVQGEALKLTVSDTGCGIPAVIRERIFDPFFTTKPKASGVGLGLSIAHTVVLAHHGKIVVDSAEGHGATFTVLLPTAGAAAHLDQERA